MKVTGKQPAASLLDQWNQVFDQVDRRLPRVGKLTITEPSILQLIQQLIPDKEVKHVITCRGSNRTIAPPMGCVKGEAPLRKCV